MRLENGSSAVRNEGRNAEGEQVNRERENASTIDAVIEAYKSGIDRTLIQHNLQLTVEDRVRQLMDLQRQAEELRRTATTLSRP